MVFGGVLVGELAHGGVSRGHGGGDAGGELQDGFFAGGGGFLREESDGASALEIDRPFIRGVVAEDEGEEGRFAGAVGSDQADAVARVDLQRGVLEEGASTEGLGDLGDGEHEREG